MNKVYAVGCLQLDLAPNARRIIIDQRLWHLFAKFEEAEQAVLQNRGDLFERSYSHALIEEVPVIDMMIKVEPGSGLFSPREWWYVADYSKADEENDYEPQIVACDKPEVLKNIIYFWIG